MNRSLQMKSVLRLLLLGCVMTSLHAVANPITRQQAQQNALAFMKERGKSVSMASLRHAPMRAAQPDEPQPYYVFNIGDNQGYVIASGDDCAYAVLGYSDEGAIDLNNLPCNLQAWLDCYAQDIQYKREHGASICHAPKRTSYPPAIAPMLTCYWGQRDPFNRKCPIDPTTVQRCVTGCVATAMAQVMYYHRDRSVNRTIQEIPAYTTRTRQIHVDAIPAGSFIDWDNMLDRYYYSSSPTEANREAVANLMKYCGAAVQMDYTSGESGAGVRDASLIRYFNYSSKTRYIRRSEFISNTEEAPLYSDEEWEEIIYNELASFRPVLYNGYDQAYHSGHAFVCDGYDGNGYFHMNWGWGSEGGFYLLAAFDADEGLNGYRSQQGAIINAEPRASLPDPDAGIHFADPETEFQCLLNWDDNDDGALSFEEAAAVSDIGSAFTGSDITSFDELKYFTGLTAIDNHAFYYCEGLTSVTLPNSVTSIGGGAFYGTGLTSITIPESVTTIGDYAFYGCTGLASVNLKNSVIGSSMFSGCTGLTSVTIPESVTTIGDYAFYGCTGLSSVNLKNSVIGRGMFNGCTGLQSVTIPNTVTTIGNDALNGIKTVIWNAKDIIPYSAYGSFFMLNFVCRSVEYLIFGDEIEEIPKYFAMDCMNLKRVDISNSVKKIGTGAFDACKGLTSITIPKSVTWIGSSAFCVCSGLNTITSLAAVPPVIDFWNAFDDSAYENATLRVPISSLEAYQSADVWNRFKNIVGIDPSSGDVNQDGEVNIADINTIVNSIMGSSNSLNDYMSDVNLDGEVNIGDINALIDIILSH